MKSFSRVLIKYAKALSVAAWISTIAVFGQTDSECYTKAASLQREKLEEEALKQVIACLNADPTDYKSVCKASFLYSTCGNRLNDVEQKRNYFGLAKRYAAVAIKRQPNDAEGHYLMAIAMGRLALISGPKDKVGASREIKQHVDEALKLNPNHAGAWFLLGKWNYEVSNLNFAEVAAAKYLFGGLPDGASVDNAISAYKKAIELNPNKLLYRSDLAIAYIDQNKFDAAKQELKTLLMMKQIEQDDPKIVAKAKQLLNDIENR